MIKWEIFLQRMKLWVRASLSFPTRCTENGEREPTLRVSGSDRNLIAGVPKFPRGEVGQIVEPVPVGISVKIGVGFLFGVEPAQRIVMNP